MIITIGKTSLAALKSKQTSLKFWLRSLPMLLHTTPSPMLDLITSIFNVTNTFLCLLYLALEMIVALAIIGAAILTAVIVIIALVCRRRKEKIKRKQETA